MNRLLSRHLPSPQSSARVRRLAWLLAAVCAAHGPHADAQPVYRLTDLGVLPGANSMQATALNDRGDVVGSASVSGDYGDSMGFVWSEGVLRGTGLLPKGNASWANAINNLGVVVGGGDLGNYRPQAWVTAGGRLLEFFPNKGGNTHAVAINDSGTICGVYTKSLGGWASSWKPALWTADPKDPRRYRTVVLPVLPGVDPTSKATTAFPAAFNEVGQVVGYAANENIGQHACLWNNDAAHSIVDLGTFPGDGSSLANGINDRGEIVGQSHPPFGSRAVVWSGDPSHTLAELALLPGDNYGSATAINNLGQVLGLSARGTPGTWDIGPSRIVVWRDGGVFPLESTLDATGEGWTLVSANDINNRGQIVGTGVVGGSARAFLLTPVGE